MQFKPSQLFWLTSFALLTLTVSATMYLLPVVPSKGLMPVSSPQSFESLVFMHTHMNLAIHGFMLSWFSFMYTILFFYLLCTYAVTIRIWLVNYPTILSWFDRFVAALIRNRKRWLIGIAILVFVEFIVCLYMTNYMVNNPFTT